MDTNQTIKKPEDNHEKRRTFLNKIAYILKEMCYMIKKDKLYFLAPILIIFALLTIVIYYIGPAAIMSFIYAGI